MNFLIALHAEREKTTLILRRNHLYTPTELLAYKPTNWQTKTTALDIVIGFVEWLENVLDQLWWDSNAFVLDPNLQEFFPDIVLVVFRIV